MRKSRFSESQIVAILKEHEAGVPTAELTRRHGIHPNTLRTWHTKYGGMESSDVSRLKQLEEENSRGRRQLSWPVVVLPQVTVLPGWLLSSPAGRSPLFSRNRSCIRRPLRLPELPTKFRRIDRWTG